MKQQILFLSIILLAFGCKTKQNIQGSNIQKERVIKAEFLTEADLLTCFDEGTKDDKGGTYNCEFSGIEITEEAIVMVNDKNVESTSPAFVYVRSVDWEMVKQDPYPADFKAFRDIRKMEDMAFTLDEKYLFITSGFDRLKEDSNIWDAYNTLLVWKVGGDNFQVISAEDNDGVVSSKSLRKKFLALLDGSTHMKIEGLVVLPGNRLVFGVREMGTDFDNPIYASIFMECTFRQEGDKFFLNDDLHISYKLDPDRARTDLGMSGMEYDPSTKSIFITTSLEIDNGQTMGSYVWKLPLADYEAGKQAILLVDSEYKPLFMPHKAEGIAKMDENTFFIIHDNDRTDVPVKMPDGTITSRKRHQAVYSIVKIKE